MAIVQLVTDYDLVREHIRETLDVSVRSGYGAPEDLFDAMEEQVYDEFYDESDETQEAELATFRRSLEDLLARQQAAEATWDAATVNDRLSRAFDALNTEGIVALEDAGYTTSDGWGDATETADSNSWGATFFHRQDVERAVNGSGLHLEFGAFTKGADHESESFRLAERVREVLGQHGLTTNWDGTTTSRISIPPFEWRRRRWTSAPDF